MSYEYIQLSRLYECDNEHVVYALIFCDIFVLLEIFKKAEIAARKISSRGAKQSVNVITELVIGLHDSASRCHQTPAAS